MLSIFSWNRRVIVPILLVVVKVYTVLDDFAFGNLDVEFAPKHFGYSRMSDAHSVNGSTAWYDVLFFDVNGL